MSKVALAFNRQNAVVEPPASLIYRSVNDEVKLPNVEVEAIVFISQFSRLPLSHIQITVRPSPSIMPASKYTPCLWPVKSATINRHRLICPMISSIYSVYVLMEIDSQRFVPRITYRGGNAIFVDWIH